jgi:hypothetical protein
MILIDLFVSDQRVMAAVDITAVVLEMLTPSLLVVIKLMRKGAGLSMDQRSGAVERDSNRAFRDQALGWTFLAQGLILPLYVWIAFVSTPDEFMRGLVPGVFGFALFAVSTLNALAARRHAILTYALVGMWLSAGALVIAAY